MTPYEQGFIDKCAELNVAPPALIKTAFVGVSWGGGGTGIAPKYGPGLEVGYSNLFGVLPIPQVTTDIGGPDHGLILGGPVPTIGVRVGHRPTGPYGWRRNFPRGLPEVAYDKAKGQSLDEAQVLQILDDIERKHKRSGKNTKPESREESNMTAVSKKSAAYVQGFLDKSAQVAAEDVTVGNWLRGVRDDLRGGTTPIGSSEVVAAKQYPTAAQVGRKVRKSLIGTDEPLGYIAPKPKSVPTPPAAPTPYAPAAGGKPPLDPLKVGVGVVGAGALAYGVYKLLQARKRAKKPVMGGMRLQPA